MFLKNCCLFLLLLILSSVCIAQQEQVRMTDSSQFKPAVFNKDFLNKVDVLTFPSSINYRSFYIYNPYQNPLFIKSSLSNNGCFRTEYVRSSETDHQSFQIKSRPAQIDSRFPVDHSEYFVNTNGWGEFIAYSLYQILYVRK